jgi:hypothetical protein
MWVSRFGAKAQFQGAFPWIGSVIRCSAEPFDLVIHLIWLALQQLGKRDWQASHQDQHSAS